MFVHRRATIYSGHRRPHSRRESERECGLERGTTRLRERKREREREREREIGEGRGRSRLPELTVAGAVVGEDDLRGAMNILGRGRKKKTWSCEPHVQSLFETFYLCFFFN